MAEPDSPWRGRKALVTGCTGFLGGAVSRELLARGAEVVGLIHKTPPTGIFGTDDRVRFVHGRSDNVFRLQSAMAIHEVVAVFHLAASEPVAEDRGTRAVIQAVKLYSSRVPVVAARPIPKLALARSEDMPEERLTVVRFGEVFGPRDRKHTRVVPAMATALHTGASTLPVDGPPRDFVFLRDAARACLLAAEAAAVSGPRDDSFCSGWILTDRQMATAVRDIHSGKPVEAGDSASPPNPLGWCPAQPLGEALAETLAWYRQYLELGGTNSLRTAA